MCFAECHLKRLLAFSTISHTGLFLLGVALLTPHGLAGSALYVLGHGLVKGSLFLAAGILLNRFGSVDENELRGAGRGFPRLGLAFLVGGLALSGLPPFGTWLGKSVLEEAAGRLDYGWLKPLLLVASALTGGAVLRAAGRVFLGIGPAPDHDQDGDTPKREEKETDEDYDRPPAVMFVPALTLLGLCARGWSMAGAGTVGGTSGASVRGPTRLCGRGPRRRELWGANRGDGIKLAASRYPLRTRCGGGALLLGVVALFPHWVPCGCEPAFAAWGNRHWPRCVLCTAVTSATTLRGSWSV